MTAAKSDETAPTRKLRDQLAEATANLEAETAESGDLRATLAQEVSQHHRTREALALLAGFVGASAGRENVPEWVWGILEPEPVA